MNLASLMPRRKTGDNKIEAGRSYSDHLADVGAKLISR